MKNHYGVDLNEVREIILSNEKHARIFNSNNQLKIKVTGSEKWNQPTEENDYGRLDTGPRSDGFFDVEGHSWTDINSFYDLNLFNAKDLKKYLNNIKSWFKDCIEVWSFNYIKGSIKFILETAPDAFSLRQEYWVWTIESLSVTKNEMVDEKVDNFFGDKLLHTIRNDYESYHKKIDEEYKKTTRDEVLAEVHLKAYQISRFMYVNKQDPTVIYIDDSIAPYDLKSGYSNLAVEVFIEIWLWYLFDKRCDIINTGSKHKAFSGLKQTLKLSSLLIERKDYSKFIEVPLEGKDGKTKGN